MGHLKVKHLLEYAVSQHIGSGMAAAHGNLAHSNAQSPQNEIFVGSTSHLNSSTSVNSETIFDLASLTKILATTTLAMKRFEEGALNLNASISMQDEFRAITVKDLLTHSSGLPAWKPFYNEMRAYFGDELYRVPLNEREKVFGDLLSLAHPEAQPAQKIVYSDLGFLWLEKVLSTSFQKEVESLWRSMGVNGLHFRPVLASANSARLASDLKHESIAATEICPWRGLLSGQVHDDNCWSKGGIAGHAGAFGRLQDVIAWIHAVFLGARLAKTTVKLFTTEAVSIDGARRALGFDMPSLDGSGSTGFSFSNQTVGHLGFTGTSLWVDLVSGDYAILLTNRVHPDRNDLRIRALRREFHRLVRE